MEVSGWSNGEMVVLTEFLDFFFSLKPLVLGI